MNTTTQPGASEAEQRADQDEEVDGIRPWRFTGPGSSGFGFDGDEPSPNEAADEETLQAAQVRVEDETPQPRTDFSEDQARDDHGRFAGGGVGLEGKGHTSGVGRPGGNTGPSAHKGEGGTAKGGGKAPKDGEHVSASNTAADKLTGEMATHPFGFSWRPDTGHATTGIMVAEHPSTGSSHVIDMGKATKESEVRNAVRAYVAKHFDQIMKDPALHFGGWKSTDEKTGTSKFYLDIARNHPKEDREKAITEGVRHNQIAVWDVDNSAEIKTGGTGE